MTAIWPDTLPMPQTEGLTEQEAPRTAVVDVMSGPSRVRLINRNARASFEFEVWFTPAQAATFDAWYAQALVDSNGEMYLPWIARGRVVAFVDGYTLAPLGRGWTLTGLVMHTRTDVSLCDAHLSPMGLIRDRGPPDTDTVIDDGTSTDVIADDFPLETLEPC